MPKSGLHFHNNSSGALLSIVPDEILQNDVTVTFPNTTGTLATSVELAAAETAVRDTLDGFIGAVVDASEAAGAIIKKPTLTLDDATLVTYSSALISGGVADYKDSDMNSVQIRCLYKTTDAINWNTSAWLSGGEYSGELVDLEPGKSYLYKLELTDVARPSIGSVESNVKSFLTTAVSEDVDSLINITGVANGPGVQALTALTVSTITNGTISNGTFVASGANGATKATAATTEYVQQGGQSDWLLVDPIIRLYPAKFTLAAGHVFPTNTLNMTAAIDTTLVAGDKLLLVTGSTVTEYNVSSTNGVTVVLDTPVATAPTAAYSGGQKLAMCLADAAGGTTYTDITATPVRTFTGDLLECNYPAIQDTGKYIKFKATLNKGDVLTTFYAELFA